MSGPLFVTGLQPGQRFCYHCGNVWFARMTTKPGRCPRCQSRRWDVPAQQMTLRYATEKDPLPPTAFPPKEQST